ncbi:hypothetical protein BJ996_007249 [Streptomyces phaeogriseichromatogenes]|nr:hypothetical protein [Streptomyces murinus]
MSVRPRTPWPRCTGRAPRLPTPTASRPQPRTSSAGSRSASSGPLGRAGVLGLLYGHPGLPSPHCGPPTVRTTSYGRVLVLCHRVSGPVRQGQGLARLTARPGAPTPPSP